MADAYSDWVADLDAGSVRSYVKGWVESEDAASVTVYAWGCADCYHVSGFGIRARLLVDGQEIGSAMGVVQSPDSMAQVAGVEGRMVIPKTEEAQAITVSCVIEGESLDASEPLPNSVTATILLRVDGVVSTPPEAPTNLTGVRDENANIVLSWISNATNASSTFVERMQKNGSWETAAAINQTVTAYTDSPGAGSFKYRVRYVNTIGFSDYSNETDYIETLCAPAPPTLMTPASGATVDTRNATARLSWIHNAIDSSLQTAAEVSWAVDDSPYQTATVGPDAFYDLPIEGNHTLYWRARTKGAHADCGPWAAVTSFLIRTPPVVEMTMPVIVENIPIPVSWTYEDAVGVQTSALLEAIDSGGKTVYSKKLGNVQSYTIPGSEFTPVHGSSYTMRLTVTSSTSLATTTETLIRASYVTPAKPDFALSVNKHAHSVKITVFAGHKAEAFLETSSLSVFRDNALIASDLLSGEWVVDYLPPLDRQVVYRVVAYATGGAAADRRESIVVHSLGFAVFNFGEDYARQAKVSLNLEESDETEGAKEFYLTASHKYPKVFYGENVTRTGSVEGDVQWKHDALFQGKRAMLSAIEELKEYNGLVFMRLPYRDALYVATDVQISRSSDQYNIASVSVGWQAVGG